MSSQKKIKIKYGGVDIFSTLNIAVPLIERESKTIIMGEKRGVKEIIKLNGKIHIQEEVAGCDYYSILLQRQQQIINTFSKNYKTLLIEEDGQTILERDFCEINSITFPDQGYLKVVDYSIDIQCYDELMHNEFFGIKNPINNTSIQKESNETYTIKRVISAVGENLQDGSLTGDNISSISSSLQNAVDFVSSLRGKEQINLPQEIENLDLFLIESSENIDRVTNKFQINETYKAINNSDSDEHGMVQFSMSREKSFGGISSVNVSGSVTGQLGESLDAARNKFKSIDFFQKVSDAFTDENYNKHPISKSINESSSASRIDFSISYNDDDNYDECGVGEDVQISIQEGDDSVVQVSVQGKIHALGFIGDRFDKVKNHFINKDYDTSSYSSWIHQRAQEEVNDFYSGVVLSKEPESESVNENENRGEINFNYSFTNKDKGDFRNLSQKIDVNMRSPKYSINMNFGSGMNKYIVNRSGFRAGSISISMNGEYDKATGNEVTDRENALSSLRGKINDMFVELESEFFEDERSIITTNNESYNMFNKASISISKEYLDEIV